MIIKIDYSKGKSTYRCDRCKFTLIKGVDKVYYVSVKDLDTNKQVGSYHLCEKHYMNLDNSLRRYTNEA